MARELHPLTPEGMELPPSLHIQGCNAQRCAAVQDLVPSFRTARACSSPMLRWQLGHTLLLVIDVAAQGSSPGPNTLSQPKHAV